jgi:hypothetical protein
LYPCSIPFHGSALNITVQSYVDRLDVGLIACRRTVPDLQVIADGLEASWTELQQAVFDHLTAHVPEVRPGNEKAGKGTDKPAEPTKSAAKRGAKREGASKKRRSPATSDIVALRPDSSDAPADPGGVDKRAAAEKA